MMEAVDTSETTVNFYDTTRCDKPEDSHVHTRRHENLKSHSVCICLPLLLLSRTVLKNDVGAALSRDVNMFLLKGKKKVTWYVLKYRLGNFLFLSFFFCGFNSGYWLAYLKRDCISHETGRVCSTLKPKTNPRNKNI
jgi:hypothetical protein